MLPMYVPESFGMYVPDMDSRIRTSDVLMLMMMSNPIYVPIRYSYSVVPGKAL
jgi:hypothetical protein